MNYTKANFIFTRTCCEIPELKRIRRETGKDLKRVIFIGDYIRTAHEDNGQFFIFIHLFGSNFLK